MNQKTLYELTITEKLEQLTAPDMVDAIWARIEAQLDLDLPTDDGPSNPPQTPKIGPIKRVRQGFIIATTAIVLIYIFNKPKQSTTSTSKPIIIAPITTPNNSNEPPKNNSPSTNIVVKPSQKEFTPTTPSNAFTFDSISSAPETGPVELQPDNSAVKKNILPATNLPLLVPQNNKPSDSVKKRRGVTGITDADYKIEPKKDSSKS